MVAGTLNIPHLSRSKKHEFAKFKIFIMMLEEVQNTIISYRNKMEE